jgi:hypothetical protein
LVTARGKVGAVLATPPPRHSVRMRRTQLLPVHEQP